MNEDSRCLQLLWVGKLDFRKQLRLAIDALALVEPQTTRLHVVGGGDAEPYKQYAAMHGMADSIEWHGAVSHDEVQQLMRQSDLLFFTSVAEGTPHVVLEAMANGLPVLCIDTCGHGDSVDSTCGVKIAMTNPTQSARDFADMIERLCQNRDELQRLSQGCTKRRESLSWEKKAEEMMDLYHKASGQCLTSTA